MKKFLSICLALVLVLSLSATVLAVGTFTPSVAGTRAPELIEGKNSDPGCDSKVYITAYADRDDLPEEVCAMLEKAYGDILNAESLADLCEAIAAIAAARGIDVADLAVSELFDISAGSCSGNHEGHGHFDITLKTEALNKFFCLLHYYNGEWVIVDNAMVTNGGEHLEFDVKEFSPFAIIVDVSEDAPEETTSPEETTTGIDDPSDDEPTKISPILIIVIIIAILAIIAAIVAPKFLKKTK